MRIALLATDAREHWHEYDKPDPYFGTAPAALMQGFNLVPDAEVHIVSCIRRPMRSPEKIGARLWYHSLIVPKSGWMATGYQGCIRAVRRKLRELQPEIVHGQGTERDCAISAVFSGFPNVLTLHGNMRLIARVNGARPLSYPWLTARLEALTLPRTRGVVCITRYTRDAVHDLVPRTWVVPNAVDAGFFDVARQPDKPPLIVCVGAICHRKNQNRFIRALEPLAAKHSFRLLFLGGGANEAVYEEEFRQLIATRTWCQYGGMAGREELKQWLARASLLALPSLEDNCPMVVLEAMAAGVPVVAANVGGVPDLVEENVTGVFCDPLVDASLHHAVRSLLEDPAWAERLAVTARARAHERYHPRRIAEQHLDIYREVLGGVPALVPASRLA